MAESKSSPKKTADAKKGLGHRAKSTLGKRVDLPVKGRFAKDVRAPKWLRAIGAYFVGAWRELRQVRWPNRRATWSLTVAVLIFTSVFMLMTIGLDTAFDWLVKRIIL